MRKASELRRRLQWLIAGLRSQDQVPLAPMWLALGGTLALAVVIAALVTFLGLQALHFREFQPEPQLLAATLYDLLKVAFAVAAGVGGVVALVTAYRRQRVAEFAHDLATRAEEREATRLFNERFATAAGQIGSESPAVRLAGVHAMAGLADDWAQQRQTCVDVLCAYLRMPYEPEPDTDAPQADRQTFRAAREVRYTVIRVITGHLRPDSRRVTSAQDWRGLDLDFTGTVFDGGDFRGAEFSGGMVSFGGAVFSGGMVRFNRAAFGSTVSFSGTVFSGGTIDFSQARFSGGIVSFRRSVFSGGAVNFGEAVFSGGTVYFGLAVFSGGTVNFGLTMFSGRPVEFRSAVFSGGTVDFRAARCPVPPSLPDWGDEPPPGVFLPPRA